MQFAFKEANTAGATLVAIAALDQLHAMLQRQADQADTATAAAQAVDTEQQLDAGTNASKQKATSQTSEGVVLRVLVKLVLTELEKHAAAAAATGKPTTEDSGADTAVTTSQPSNEEAVAEKTSAAAAAAAGCLAQLSEALSRVAVRIKRLGLEIFTGEKEASATQQLEWFSICAWNAGLHAARRFLGYHSRHSIVQL